jgi:hypothetical protein
MSEVLHLSVRPQWEQVDTARQETVLFLRRHHLHEEAIHAATMIVCELTENATKYGFFDGEEVAIRISVSVTPGAVTVEVKSPVAKGCDDHLKRLDRAVQWIRGFQSPFEAYLERLKEISAQSLESRESGLGLARVAYEGQSILDFFVNEHDVLAVSAVHRFNA